MTVTEHSNITVFLRSGTKSALSVCIGQLKTEVFKNLKKSQVSQELLKNFFTKFFYCVNNVLCLFKIWGICIISGPQCCVKFIPGHCPG